MAYQILKCYNIAIVKRRVLEYNAIFQKEQEGGYSVWIPSLPGCASQGETFEKSLKNIQEAITLYLENADKEEEVEASREVRSQFMVPVAVAA